MLINYWMNYLRIVVLSQNWRPMQSNRYFPGFQGNHKQAGKSQQQVRPVSNTLRWTAPWQE